MPNRANSFFPQASLFPRTPLAVPSPGHLREVNMVSVPRPRFALPGGGTSPYCRSASLLPWPYLFAMDLGYLTPALERIYVEKLRRLHSLWHRGAPRNPNTSPSLRPTACTAFKKEAMKKKSKSKWEKKRLQQSSADASNTPAKEAEWQCNPSPKQNAAPDTWTDLAALRLVAQPRPPASAEEQARAVADRAQQSGLKASEDFFSKKDDSDEGEDEGDSMDVDEESEEVVFKFFLGLFERDGKLREYYEKNWEKGEFSCLVCGAIGVGKWKRFGDCVGLIQHSNSISKTKRRDAHRAFGRAVCTVLGWDINRLPSIVLDLGTSLGQSSAQASDPEEDMEKEDLATEVEEVFSEVAANVGADKVDSVAKEIQKKLNLCPAKIYREKVKLMRT